METAIFSAYWAFVASVVLIFWGQVTSSVTTRFQEIACDPNGFAAKGWWTRGFVTQAKAQRIAAMIRPAGAQLRLKRMRRIARVCTWVGVSGVAVLALSFAIMSFWMRP